MKRWAIVNLQTLEIESEYRSVASLQGKNMFGGTWDDPSRFIHVVVMAALDSFKIQDLKCVFEDPGQTVDDSGELEWDYVSGPIVPAFDDNLWPILGSHGEQLNVQRFTRVPRLGPVYRVQQR